MDMRMAHEILTEEDKRKLGDYAASIHWGFAPNDLMDQLEKYRNGTDHDKAEVLYLLEDCNYHTEAGLLIDEDYDGLYALTGMQVRTSRG